MKIEDVSDTRILQAASRFAALGSEQRLAVLRTLVRAGPDGLSIGDLGQRTGTTGSTLTHHMKVLSDAGLVRQVKEGRRILCHAVYDEMQALSEFLLTECCVDSTTSHPEHDHG